MDVAGLAGVVWMDGWCGVLSWCHFCVLECGSSLLLLLLLPPLLALLPLLLQYWNCTYVRTLPCWKMPLTTAHSVSVHFDAHCSTHHNIIQLNRAALLCPLVSLAHFHMVYHPSSRSLGSSSPLQRHGSHCTPIAPSHCQAC